MDREGKYEILFLYEKNSSFEQERENKQAEKKNKKIWKARKGSDS